MSGEETIVIAADQRTVAPVEAIAPLLERADAPAFGRLAAHATAIAAFGLFVAALRGTIWVLPAMAIEGVLVIFLFAPLHECIHRTAFKSRWLNDIVGFAIGLLLFLPRDYFRAFHFAHHRHTQDPRNDPELLTPKPATRGQWVLVVSGWLYWQAQIRGLLRHARGVVDEPFVRDPSIARAIIREARLALGIYGLLCVLSLWAKNADLFWYWIGPILLGQPFLRLFLLAEHTLRPMTPDMLMNSRTTISNALIRFFAWNMCYHAEHHAHPGVPFHQLPNLHMVLSPYLGCVAEGYWSVNREIFRELKQ